MAKSSKARKDATEMQAEDARVGFADVLNRVGFLDERVVITRYGKRIAALVPIADFDRIQAA